MTPVWGQVNVLDPGDYGSVTITQSMTIETSGSGQIISNGNNSFANNGTNGAPTKTVSLF